MTITNTLKLTMEIDNWWEEIEHEPELLDWIKKVAEETILAVDPIPGLVAWLKKHGLGVVPLDRELFEEADDKRYRETDSYWKATLKPPPTTSEPNLFSKTVPHELRNTGIIMGDRVKFRTAPGKTTKIGEGVVVGMGKDTCVIDTGNNRLITILFDWGDIITKIENDHHEG